MLSSIVRSFTVTFDETGEERRVVAHCRRCWPDAAGHVPEPKEIDIVSPRFGRPGGIGHKGSGGDGRTVCGVDATGDDWWHRL